jgi:predicted RNA-binding Zn ribbon-like protein
MKATEESREFELTGGAVCLDFVNTLGDRPRSTEESLDSYDDILRWSRQAQTLPTADLDELESLAHERPESTPGIFKSAIALREMLYRIFSGLACGEKATEDDLELLNSALSKAMRQLEIRERDGAFEWEWGGPSRALDRPLWPVIRSAAELLTSRETKQIRECASDTCSWLFIDRSRNRRRRWCDMTTCGNRAKARRHYERRKRSSLPR